MTFLHTADWHIGKKLYGRDRFNEHEAFFKWLVATIKEREVDVLLVAGDVFDTATPSNRSLELYYYTLITASTAGCRHIVVIGGNHDSPSLLNAPRELCAALNIHVVGCSNQPDLEKEVILLKDEDGEVAAIICAVPYLRDRDLRTVTLGESDEEKDRKYIAAITEYYTNVGKIAEKLKKKYRAPVIGMGHLSTVDGKTGEGVRDLYVGNKAHLKASSFPMCFDYLALGHLHVPQMVGGKNHMRYSGSPIQMGFGEAGQGKEVVLFSFDVEKPEITSLPVPIFQPLERVEGDLEQIAEKLKLIARECPKAWVQIAYSGGMVDGDLREECERLIENTSLEIRMVVNTATYRQTVSSFDSAEVLETMDERDVFIKCLEGYEIPEAERAPLISAYEEVVQALAEEDFNAV